MEDILEDMVKDEVIEQKMIEKKIYQKKELQDKRKRRREAVWSLRGAGRNVKLIGGRSCIRGW